MQSIKKHVSWVLDNDGLLSLHVLWRSAHPTSSTVGIRNSLYCRTCVTVLHKPVMEDSFAKPFVHVKNWVESFFETKTNTLARQILLSVPHQVFVLPMMLILSGMMTIINSKSFSCRLMSFVVLVTHIVVETMNTLTAGSNTLKRKI